MLPAANLVLVQRRQQPPATRKYNFRVDMRDPCDVQKRAGRPQSEAQWNVKKAVPTADVLIGSATQPLYSAQITGRLCGTGQASYILH